MSSDYDRYLNQKLAEVRDPEKRMVLEFQFRHSWKRVPMEKWAETYITIKDKKTGKLRLIKKNKPQRILSVDLFRALRGEILWRPIILKARQFGVSTWMCGQILEATVNVPSLTSGICGDKKKRTDGMRDKVRDALRELPWTEPKTTDNRDELKLQRNNARILFDSAEHGHPFRGETVRIAHCTETSIWEDVFKALAALNNAVPEQPGTVLAHESTANGIGNPFHEMWEQACKGHGNLMPYFFPWWIDPEFDYVAQITETERLEIMHTKDEEEKALLFDGFDIGGDTVFCTPEQVAWRRRAIIDKCMGDPDQFRQEYPSNPDEAFLKPGRSLFAPAVVKKHLAHCEEPDVCTITYRKPQEPGGRLRYDIDQNSNGKLSIWKKPNPKYNYVVACDSSEGVGQDNTAIMVMCVQTRELVASWVCCDTQPYQAGLILACIGHFYQGAFLWPESNSPGPAVIQALRDVAYPLIGLTPSLEEGTVVNHGRLGWRSTQKSRPLAMNELRNAMREDSIRIRCRQTLLEANSMYIEKTAAGNDTYKYPKGGRIDRVDSLAVALFACRFVQDYDVFEVPNQQIRLTYDEQHWQEYREMVEPEPATDLQPLPGYEGSHAWDPKDRESFTL